MAGIPDPSQFYSPIIQAMIHSANNNREMQQNAALAEQRKQELALRQQEADRASKHLDFTEKSEQAKIDSEAEVRKAQQKHQLLTDKLDVGKAVREGILNAPSSLTPNAGAGAVQGISGNSGVPTLLSQPQSSGGQVAGINFEPGELSNPAQAEAQRVQGQVAQQQALLPGQKEAETFKQGLTDQSESKKLQQQQEFQTSQKELDRKNEEHLHNLDNRARATLAAGNNATTLAAAHLAHDIPPSQLQSGLYSLATGDRNFNSDNPYDRAVQSGAQAAGIRPVSPKEIDTLKASQLIEPTLNKVQEFVNGLPSEKDQGAGVKGAIGGFITKHSPFRTQDQTKLAEIKPGVMNVARDLEGLTGGRVTQQQMGIFVDALADPSTTREKGQEILNNMKDLAVNKENNTILGGMGITQKKMIYQKYGIKPAFLIGVPDKNAKGHSLDVQSSIDYNQPVYSNGGK
jgi:hypothetical protein